MSSKTIKIDMEAYELLKANKKRNESFSSVIKRRIKKPVGAKVLEKRFIHNALDDDAIKSIEKHIRFRHKRIKRKR